LITKSKPRTYQIKKYIHRNHVLVASAAVIVLILIIGIIVSTFFSIRANGEMTVVEQNKNEAETENPDIFICDCSLSPEHLVKLKLFICFIGLMFVIGLVGFLVFLAHLIGFFKPTRNYRATTESIKDVCFRQPNLNNSCTEQSKHIVEMSYSQIIQSVNTDGNTTAMIKINSLKIDIVNENEAKLSFDSQSNKDEDVPMTQLVGQCYIIQTTPTGEAKVFDTQAAIESVQWAYDKEVVQSILGPKVISERHQITALPKDKLYELSAKKTWSTIFPSPIPLLTLKSYKKTYTLMSINDNVATFEMTGTESAEPAESSTQSGDSKEMPHKEFDNKDDYTGVIKINLTSREALLFEETLISNYIAKRNPENSDSEKENDPLSITFTFRKKIEPI